MKRVTGKRRKPGCRPPSVSEITYTPSGPPPQCLVSPSSRESRPRPPGPRRPSPRGPRRPSRRVRRSPRGATLIWRMASGGVKNFRTGGRFGERGPGICSRNKHAADGSRPSSREIPRLARDFSTPKGVGYAGRNSQDLLIFFTHSSDPGTRFPANPRQGSRRGRRSAIGSPASGIREGVAGRPGSAPKSRRRRNNGPDSPPLAGRPAGLDNKEQHHGDDHGRRNR